MLVVRFIVTGSESGCFSCLTALHFHSYPECLTFMFPWVNPTWVDWRKGELNPWNEISITILVHQIRCVKYHKTSNDISNSSPSELFHQCRFGATSYPTYHAFSEERQKYIYLLSCWSIGKQLRMVAISMHEFLTKLVCKQMIRQIVILTYTLSYLSLEMFLLNQFEDSWGTPPWGKAP